MDQVAPNTPPAIPPTPKPSILPVVLSFFLCISLAGVGLLAYQNMVLQRQIASLQTQPSTTASPTPQAKPDPALRDTANWKTYINTNNGYSIKYPQIFLRLICPDEELTLTNKGVDNRIGPIEMSTCARGGRYTLETKTHESIQPEPQETKYYTIEKKNILLGSLQAKQYTYTFTNIEVGPFPIWYTIAKVDKNGRTFEIYFDDKNSSQLFDQILSTFKFSACKPRPACLDATPRCLIPETSDMCPPNQKL